MIDKSFVESVQQPKILQHDNVPVMASTSDGAAIVVLPIQRCEWSFGTPMGLAAWMAKHARPEVSHTLVSDGMAVCIAEPDDADAHTASADLVAHPRIKPWLEVVGRKLGQRDLAALTRGQRSLVEGDGGQRSEGFLRLHAAVHGLQAARGAKVEHHLDPVTGRSTLSSASSSSTIETVLPETVEIIAPWYVGVRLPVDGELVEPQYRVTLAVEVEVDDAGRAVFVLRCPLREVVQLRAIEDVAGCIYQAAGGRHLVELGEAEQVVRWSTVSARRRVLVDGVRDDGPDERIWLSPDGKRHRTPPEAWHHATPVAAAEDAGAGRDGSLP